jgi:hypothetical protein
MIIVAQKCGQLGNRLILGAHLIAFAKEFGWTVHYPAFSDYAPFFEGPHRTPWCTFPLSRSKGSCLTSGCVYRFANFSARAVRRLGIRNRWLQSLSIHGDYPHNNVDLAVPMWRERIDQSALVFLLGWRVRNYRLVDKHQGEIRRFFEPVAAIRQKVSSYLGHARVAGRPLVGVHIRQRDYKQYQGGRHYLESHQYAAYMRRLASLLGGRPRFVVCSDTPQENAHFEGLDVAFGPGQLVEDMHVLAGCDFVIGVPSTFSGWAAFYGRAKLYAIDGVPPEEVKLEDFAEPGLYAQGLR